MSLSWTGDNGTLDEICARHPTSDTLAFQRLRDVARDYAANRLDMYQLDAEEEANALVSQVFEEVGIDLGEAFASKHVGCDRRGDGPSFR
jgi:hypothetical protein